MSSINPLGTLNNLAIGSSVLATINAIRAQTYATAQQPSSAAQAQIAAQQNTTYAGNIVYYSGAQYRPSEWAQNKPLFQLIVPPQSQQSTSGNSGNLAINPIVYVFDAIWRSDHDEGIKMTELPVQTGANISDNAYVLPNRITLEIGMSDVMDSFTPGQWSNNASKSVAAYQILQALKNARQFVSLVTRLAVYNNMLVERLTAQDTAQTRYGLRALVTFRQVFVASVTVSYLNPATNGTSGGIGTRDWTTNLTAASTAGTSPLSNAAYQQNVIKLGQAGLNQVPVYNSTGQLVGVSPLTPGGGNVSSSNTGNIQLPPGVTVLGN